MGRQSDYSETIADAILSGLADGMSLRSICDDEAMPDRSTVLRWLAAHEDFAAKYARAREAQADAMDELILDTANTATPETAAVARVKIDAYKWRASKLKPKVYGDKIEHTGPGGGPVLVQAVTGVPQVGDADTATDED